MKVSFVSQLVSRIYFCVALTALSLTAVAEAAQVDVHKQYTFNLPRQTVADSLNDIAKHTGAQFLFPYELAKSVTAKPVSGYFTLLEATSQLLQNTGLKSDLVDGVLTISSQDDASTAFNQSKGKSMNIKHRKSLLATLVGLFAAGGAATATAQDEMQESARAQSVLEEIVVTATKKGIAENVQDIPIAVTAITSNQLEQMHFDDLTDLGSTIPNAQLHINEISTNKAEFYIRGVGVAGNPSMGGDSAVGVSIDGMALSSPFGVITDMFDVESIEVLRGPQGTLFGLNSTGGVVVINTKRPSGEFGGSVRTIVGSDDRKDVAFSIEDALIDDVLAARISLVYNDRDGYFKNDIDPGDRVGSERMSMAHSSFRYTPREDLTVDMILEYAEGDHEAPAQRALLRDPVVGFTPSSDPTVVSMDYTGGPDKSRREHAILEVNWEVGGGVLTSISAYRDFSSDVSLDLDGMGHVTTYSFNINGGGSGTKQLHEQISEELRYATNINEDIQLTSGLYYSEQKATVYNHWLGDNDNVGGWFGVSTQDQTALGLFAQSDINVADDFVLTLGARYTEEEKEVDIGILNTCDEGFKNCEHIIDDNTWSNMSYRLGLQWLLSDRSQAYIAFNRGFRSGGYNLNIHSFQPRVPPIYDEEIAETVELGWKSDLLDNRLRLNVAAFFNRYDDYQLIGRFQIPGTPGRSPKVVNAGEVEVKGIEAELNYLVTDRFSINTSIGLLDAEIKSIIPLDITGDGIVDPELTNDLGLALVPDLTFNLTMLYNYPVSTGGLVTLRGNYGYEDEKFGAGVQNETIIASSQTVDLSATYLTSDEKIRLSLFGKNLTDEYKEQELTSNNTSGFYTLAPRKPRTWGVEVMYSF
ncbi:TonB-dependent receptor [Porticoccaceae bacterium]|nr:TonB-dependent receptor [Porticoccaceae bacterium]